MHHICIQVPHERMDAACTLIQSIRTHADIQVCIHILPMMLSVDEMKKLVGLSDEQCTVIAERKTEANLASIFPDVDKLLYLDSGALVLQSLGELFQMPLDGKLCAAVQGIKPSGMLAKTWLQVVLYDLKAIRSSGLSTSQALKESIHPLSIRWAYTPSVLHAQNASWKAEKINEVYGTTYTNRKEVYQDAAIAVFDDTCAPWIDSDVPMGPRWLHEYLQLPFADAGKRPVQNGDLAVSVIIPCWNTEAWIEDALNSILMQKEVSKEILCMDDGSSDGTMAILNAYAEKYPEVRVISNENHGQGWERNQAMQLARGKYIYFMDSDDILENGALVALYTLCEENRLDIVFFEGTTFYDTEELKERYSDFDEQYTRKNAWPAVYDARDLFSRWYANSGEKWFVCCVMMLARREMLLQHQVRFADTIMYEDNVYYYRLFEAAKRVSCVPEGYYKRRVRASSTMTGEKPPALKADAIAAVAEGLAKGLSTDDHEAFREATLTRYYRLMDLSSTKQFYQEHPVELENGFARRVAYDLLETACKERQETITSLCYEQADMTRRQVELKRALGGTEESEDKAVQLNTLIHKYHVLQ